MKKTLLMLLAVAIINPLITYAADNGLITKKSKYSTEETLDRLTAALKEKGIRVFARISHDENADAVGIKVAPTELLIFGNPKLGSNLLTSSQVAGIDLPMKALSWQDKDGQVWLTYNDPSYIAKRHNIKDRKDIVAKMAKALENLSVVATGQ